jgi:hypothetical protein
MHEKVIEIKVCQYATEKGMMQYKTASPSRRGFPDRMFITKEGTVFFIEFKSSTGELTRLQEKTIKDLIEYKQKVCVVNNVAQGIDIIDKFLSIDEMYVRLRKQSNEVSFS